MFQQLPGGLIQSLWTNIAHDHHVHFSKRRAREIVGIVGNVEDIGLEGTKVKVDTRDGSYLGRVN